MSATRQVVPDYRNNFTSTLLDGFVRAFPEIDLTAIEPAQLEAAQALLVRDPYGRSRAFRVLLCPPLHGPRQPIWTRACRQRACPRCAERRARGLARRIIERALGYSDPVALLVTCPSRGLFDLPATLDRFRGGLARIRRRRWFRSVVRAGTLALETPLTKCGRRWAAHGHGILDATEQAHDAPWAERLGQEWREVAGIPGAVFEVEALGNPAALARYALKVGAPKSWAPGGFELPAHLRAHLDRTLHGRRLVLSWGQGRD